MRERLEQSESQLQNIEAEAEQIEQRMEEIEHAIEEIESTIQALESKGDHEAATALQKNLQQKQQEKLQEVQQANQVTQQLEQVQSELNEVKRLNAESKSELSALASIGENVGEAQSVVEERDNWVQRQEQEYHQLKQRLAQLSGAG
jgi:predicted  nucleic acid-binding Zn-ribbon protein